MQVLTTTLRSSVRVRVRSLQVGRELAVVLLEACELYPSILEQSLELRLSMVVAHEGVRARRRELRAHGFERGAKDVGELTTALGRYALALEEV